MPLKGSRNTPLTKPEVAGLGGPGRCLWHVAANIADGVRRIVRSIDCDRTREDISRPRSETAEQLEQSDVRRQVDLESQVEIALCTSTYDRREIKDRDRAFRE